MKNVKRNQGQWKRLTAILIVAVMLFTTPHIVGFASMSSEEAVTTSAAKTDMAGQSEEQNTGDKSVQTEEAGAQEATEQPIESSPSSDMPKKEETQPESDNAEEKAAEKTTEKQTEETSTKEDAETGKERNIEAAQEQVTEEKSSSEEETLPEEESAEEADTSEESNIKEKKIFRYENDDVKVEVKESEAGVIADNAKLQIVPIEQDNEDTQKQYVEVKKQLLEKAQNEIYDIAGFLAYDISFVDEKGNKIEPDGKVQVSMEYKRITMPEELKDRKDSKDTDVTVMHLEEDTSGKVKEVVDLSESKQLKDITTTAKKVVKKVDFETESFSTFTIIWKQNSRIQTTVNIVDDRGKAIELSETNAVLSNLEIDAKSFYLSSITETSYSQYYKLTDSEQQNYQFMKAVVTDSSTSYDGTNGTDIISLEVENSNTYYRTKNDQEGTTLENKTLYFVYTEMLSTVETVDSASKGIKIKMIDLEGEANKYLKNGDNSINLGGNYGSGNTQGIIKTGLVGKRLGSDGYPVATNNAGSLSKLFSGATETNHLFIKSIYDNTGYYEYSSFENYAYLNTSSSGSTGSNAKEFKVYKQIGTPKNEDSYYYKRGNFMPYNSIIDGRFSTNKNLHDEDGNVLTDTAPRKGEKLYLVNETPNYYFGMEVSANFVQQKNGQVIQNGKKEPMVYEFNGDDDMWVFIDGTLVLDIGGIHDAHSGKINFATGVVSWKNCVTGGIPTESSTTIKELFKSSGYFPDGNPWNNDKDKVDDYFKGDTFKDYSSHTMRMFYFERGAGASNLHMKFNLPVVPDGSIEVKKELSNTDKEKYANVRFKFKVYAQKSKEDVTGTFEENTYEVLKAAKMADGNAVTFDDDGAFYLKPGQKATFSGLKDHQKYYVEEIGVKSEEYDDIKINDVTYKAYKENESEEGKEVRDIRTSEEVAENRRLVVFTNNCSAANKRELRIIKAMQEGQTTDDKFSFRIYLTSTEGKLVPYVGPYYLYCVNDGGENKKETIYYKNENGKLRAWESGEVEVAGDKVAGDTDSKGQITGVPVGYTISITQILSGTKFKVEEINLNNQEYKVPTITVSDCKDVDISKEYTAEGTIKLGKDASVFVTNHKNYKVIKAEKKWKDSKKSDGTRAKNPDLEDDLKPASTFLGLYYKKDDVQPEQPEQVKQVDATDAANQWNCEFEIPGNRALSDYTVREVVKKGEIITVQ